MTWQGRPPIRFLGFKFAAALFLLLAGCTTSPTARVQRICAACQIIELNRDSAPPLLAYYRPAKNQNNDTTLHIYLDGDGLPWQFNRPGANPTSRKMTALHLMQLEGVSSLYLSRPCYGYRKPPTTCVPEDWTSGRYSEDIVSKMDRAIDQFKSEADLSLILIGYSGGGTLAMLLAARRADVAGVVTVAANLDHQAWSDHHGYLPLHNSLNAAKQPNLPADIFRWHLGGGKDIQVPADLINAAASRDPYARYLHYPEFDHTCCWADIWHTLLKDIYQLRASTGTK